VEALAPNTLVQFLSLPHHSTSLHNNLSTCLRFVQLQSNFRSSYRSISAARARPQQQTHRQPLLLSIDGTDRQTDGHSTVFIALTAHYANCAVTVVTISIAEIMLWAAINLVQLMSGDWYQSVYNTGGYYSKFWYYNQSMWAEREWRNIRLPLIPLSITAAHSIFGELRSGIRYAHMLWL